MQQANLNLHDMYEAAPVEGSSLFQMVNVLVSKQSKLLQDKGFVDKTQSKPK